jgi:hypothetical protein
MLASDADTSALGTIRLYVVGSGRVSAREIKPRR